MRKLSTDPKVVKHRESSRKWRLNNPDYGKRYRDANKDRQKDWYLKNKEREQERSRNYYHENTDSYRNSYYLRDFGITLSDYNTMLREQGGVCKICAQPSNDGKRLRVDHCHTTGKVRGLLCRTCNLAIGHLRDSPVLANKLADYLLNSLGENSHSTVASECNQPSSWVN
jgi:hypothetical protein